MGANHSFTSQFSSVISDCVVIITTTARDGCKSASRWSGACSPLLSLWLGPASVSSPGWLRAKLGHLIYPVVFSRIIISFKYIKANLLNGGCEKVTVNNVVADTFICTIKTVHNAALK